MASIFTKIIQGEIPCYKIAESDDFLAFLDVNPNVKGHTLCIPKMEVDKIFDLNETTYQELMKFSRKVAIALEKEIKPPRHIIQFPKVFYNIPINISTASCGYAYRRQELSPYREYNILTFVVI